MCGGGGSAVGRGWSDGGSDSSCSSLIGCAGRRSYWLLGLLLVAAAGAAAAATAMADVDTVDCSSFFKGNHPLPNRRAAAPPTRRRQATPSLPKRTKHPMQSSRLPNRPRVCGPRRACNATPSLRTSATSTTRCLAACTPWPPSGPSPRTNPW